MNKKQFQKIVLDFFQKNKRDFPWRDTTNSYHILISEVMLQQTQTYRVEPKYQEFIKRFPNFEALTKASLADVLKVWQGLGYNRRGKYLWESAKMVIDQYNGKLPDSIEELQKLPGIGYATACSIAAFAFNQPTIFIETNIRSVFIHFFFSDQENISDTKLLPLIKSSLDRKRPREWYWALMDYGTMLKKTKTNPSRLSKHHVKQTKFEGSNRQLRGAILKQLLQGSVTHKQLLKILDKPANEVELALIQLLKEGMIIYKRPYITIA